MKNSLRFLYIRLLFIFSLNLQAQQVQNPDSLFQISKDSTENGIYLAAIEQLEKLTTEFPGNNDYVIYLSRVYFWNSDYEKARANLTDIISQNPQMLKL